MPRQHGRNQGQGKNIRTNAGDSKRRVAKTSNGKSARTNKTKADSKPKRQGTDISQPANSKRRVQQAERQSYSTPNGRKIMPAGSRSGKRGSVTLFDPGNTADTNRRALADVININRSVLKELALWRFFDLDIVGSPSPNTPKYVVVKTSHPINADAIMVANESSDIPTMKVHYLYSSGLLFAYMFELPRWTVNVQPNFLSLVRPSAGKTVRFTEARMLLQDANISLLHSEDGATLACFTERYTNLSTEIIRGGSGT